MQNNGDCQLARASTPQRSRTPRTKPYLTSLCKALNGFLDQTSYKLMHSGCRMIGIEKLVTGHIGAKTPVSKPGVVGSDKTSLGQSRGIDTVLLGICRYIRKEGTYVGMTDTDV